MVLHELECPPDPSLISASRHNVAQHRRSLMLSSAYLDSRCYACQYYGTIGYIQKRRRNSTPNQLAWQVLGYLDHGIAVE
jgi:hypothetical protein